MKYFLVLVPLFLISYTAAAQNDFTGIANYKITVEGNNNPATDSMSIIFGKQKVKVVLYLPDLKRPGHISEKSFIDDFSAHKSISLNDEEMTYKTDTLKTSTRYAFINSMKIGVSNNALCFLYKADSTNFDRSKMVSVVCLGSIDYRDSFIKNYFFLGIQPVIIDNRIVMDFIVTKPAGIKERIYISAVTKTDDVERYFSLKGYSQVK